MELTTERHHLQRGVKALLVRLEDWVHSVAWQPPGQPRKGAPRQPLCVLSASMDRTMMLWRPDAATGVLLGVWLFRRMVSRLCVCIIS